MEKAQRQNTMQPKITANPPFFGDDSRLADARANILSSTAAQGAGRANITWRIYPLLWLLVAVMSFSACITPKYKTCRQTSDCPVGLHCVASACIPNVCKQNADCIKTQQCIKGSCQDGVICQAPATLCGELCTNTANDVLHCGRCNNECTDGKSCEEGSCQLVCPEGTEACLGTCFVLTSSRDHCGKCGNTCNSKEICANGTCEVPCAPDQKACGAICVEVNIDPAHCGACNNRCLGGRECVAGQCACTQSATACNGVCVSTQTDAAHCGSCNNACQSLEVCSLGQCTANCAQAEEKCGSSCTTIASDKNNCGKCGNLCPLGKECKAGNCVCPDSKVDCGGTCFDPTSSGFHCGGCDKKCSNEQQCIAGMCKCTDVRLTNCNGVCADLEHTEAHCGSCSNQCSSTATCIARTCQSTWAIQSSHPAGSKSNVSDMQLQGSYLYIAGKIENAAQFGSISFNKSKEAAFVAKISGVGVSAGQWEWVRFLEHDKLTPSIQQSGIAVDAQDQIYIGGRFRGVLRAYQADNQNFAKTLKGGEDTAFYIAKLSGKGDWLQLWNGEAGTSLNLATTDAQGNIIFSGNYKDNINDIEPMIVKLKPDTTLETYKYTAGLSGDTFRDVAALPNGEIFFAGFFSNQFDQLKATGTGRALVGVRTSETKTESWSAQSAFAKGQSFAEHVVLDKQENAYIAGHYKGAITFGQTTLPFLSGNYDIFVAQLLKSSAGYKWGWSTRAGAGSIEYIRGLAIDSKGYLYVVGEFDNSTQFDSIKLTSKGGRDVFVAKLSPQGKWLWAKSGGGASHDQAQGIAIDSQDNYYITGTFGGTATFGRLTLTSKSTDVFVTKNLP